MGAEAEEAVVNGNGGSVKEPAGSDVDVVKQEEQQQQVESAGEKQNNITTEENERGKEKEKETLSNLLNDDEVATTLAEASKKLAAAHAKEKKEKKSPVAKLLSALHPRRLVSKFRDCYVNSCMMAAERGDFAVLVAGHPGMVHGGDSLIMSRTASQKRERDQEELASLSRQLSASLSRQQSQTKTRGTSPGFHRTPSTGIAGLNRNSSAGIAGLSRQTSTGMGLKRTSSTGIAGMSRQGSTGGGIFGRNSSTRRHVDSDLFKSGRTSFLESVGTGKSNPQNVQLPHSTPTAKSTSAIQRPPNS